jgi:MFS family permease
MCAGRPIASRCVRRLLVFVGAVVFVETIFLAVLAPLLPTLTDELDLAKWQSGLLVGAYPLGAIAGALPAGLLSSRLGVRRVVVVGLLLITIASVGFAVVDEYWALVVTRLVQGAAGAFCWTGALAWLVSLTPRERRGEMIGFALAAGIAGALLGPVLGWGAVRFGRDSAFLAVAGISVVLAFWALRTQPPPRGERQPIAILARVFRSRAVVLGMWLLVLPALLFGVVATLAPLQLDRLGWGAVGVASTFLLAAAAEAAINPGVGRWSDRAGRLAPVRIGLLGAAAVSLVIPWIGDRLVLSLFVVLAGLAYGVFWTPVTALLSDAWEAEGVEHGLGFGLMSVAWAPGVLLGAAAGGALADAAGDQSAYAVVAGLCVATLMLVLRPATGGRHEGGGVGSREVMPRTGVDP